MCKIIVADVLLICVIQSTSLLLVIAFHLAGFVSVVRFTAVPSL